MSVMDILLANPKFQPGAHVFLTPSKRREFTIKRICKDYVRISAGRTGSQIRIPAACFNTLPGFLAGKGRVKIGASHSRPVKDSIDWFLQKYSHASCASYVAPILEEAGILKIDSRRPGKARLL